jgi:hypothetical protein
MMATNNSSDRMRGAEYRKAIGVLNLLQIEAADLLGVDERTSRRWANDEREIPAPVARFLRYLIATGKSGAYAIKKLEGLPRFGR